MLEILKQFNYTPPEIKPIKVGDLEVVDIKGLGERYQLKVKDKEWMTYNIHSHEEVFEVFSHYHLAYGDVVTTGMGFGAREAWLLANPRVKSLTVVEMNEEVIEYHRHIGSPWLEKVKILHQDARNLKLKCDVLLLDHYQFEKSNDILKEVKLIHDNVECDVMWFWPFERIIMEARKWYSDNDPNGGLYTKDAAYNRIKLEYELSKFPELDFNTVNMFCFMYNSKMFSNSEWHLKNDLFNLEPMKRHI